VAGVCKQLGVDYAMALTGWDIRQGRSVPRIEGVIVCEEFAQAVEELWLTEQR
jgi:xeroderma pigmentosum group C-complementing protein